MIGLYFFATGDNNMVLETTQNDKSSCLEYPIIHAHFETCYLTILTNTGKCLKLHLFT